MSRRELDFYETQAGLTHALLAHVRVFGSALEPAAGSMAISSILRTNRNPVTTNDISYEYATDYNEDATNPDSEFYKGCYNWVVTNPPFSAAMPILRNSWGVARVGVALLLRLSFLEPAGERSDYRGEWLQNHRQYMSHLLIFGQPRPSFTGNGTDSVTTAWMVWQKNHVGGTDVRFITNWRETRWT